MTSLVKVTASEDAWLAELLKDRKEAPSVAIPDDLEPRDVLASIRSCTSMLVKIQRAGSWLVPVLGRLLALVAKNKEILEKSGYATLAEYEKAELLDKGIGRSTLWKAKAVVEQFPELALEEYSKISSENLARAAVVAKRTNANEAQKKKLVEKAAELPTEQYKNWVESESGLSAPGDTTCASFQLIGTATEIADLKSLLAEEALVRWSGTTKALGMVLAALRESSTQWEGGEVLQRVLVPAKAYLEDGDAKTFCAALKAIRDGAAGVEW